MTTERVKLLSQATVKICSAHGRLPSGFGLVLLGCVMLGIGVSILFALAVTFAQEKAAHVDQQNNENTD